MLCKGSCTTSVVAMSTRIVSSLWVGSIFCMTFFPPGGVTTSSTQDTVEINTKMARHDSGSHRQHVILKCFFFASVNNMMDCSLYFTLGYNSWHFIFKDDGIFVNFLTKATAAQRWRYTKERWDWRDFLWPPISPCTRAWRSQLVVKKQARRETLIPFLSQLFVLRRALSMQ